MLPGAHLISGIGVPRIQIQEDLLSIYVASRMLILTYFLLYIAFSIARDDGWGYQHYLMAWVLSLFAQFKAVPSVAWLGLTTGVFLQGIGVRPCFCCYIPCGKWRNLLVRELVFCAHHVPWPGFVWCNCKIKHDSPEYHLSFLCDSGNLDEGQKSKLLSYKHACVHACGTVNNSIPSLAVTSPFLRLCNPLN